MGVGVKKQHGEGFWKKIILYSVCTKPNKYRNWSYNSFAHFSFLLLYFFYFRWCNPNTPLPLLICQKDAFSTWPKIQTIRKIKQNSASHRSSTYSFNVYITVFYMNYVYIPSYPTIFRL